jgi:hypothetical protein
MGRVVPGLVLAFAVALVLAAGSGGEPLSRVFVPGESLGGVELGMTRAQVLREWGRRHGVCRDCTRTTWYFNQRRFQPQGKAVVFERGRVVQAFTVWQPTGWATPGGLELGDAEGGLAESGLILEERRCVGYDAHVSTDKGADSVVYVFRERVWGFGLVRPGTNPCP